MPEGLRSLLVFPAKTWNVETAWAAGPDAVVIQGWAQSLPPDRIPNERVRALLNPGGSEGRRTFVEVDALDPGAMAAALDAAMPGAPEGIVLMNSRGAESVQRLGAKLAVLEAEHGIADGRTRIIAVCASVATGLFAMGTYRNASPRLSGLGWNAVALAADLGLDSSGSPLADPLRLARALTIAAAKAARVMAFDTPSNRVGQSFEAECARARRDGFGGKFTLDPKQVATVNASFETR